MGQQRLTLAPPSLLLPHPPSCKHPSLTDVPELSDFGAEAEAEGGLLPETVSTLGQLAVHWEDFQGPGPSCDTPLVPSLSGLNFFIDKTGTTTPAHPSSSDGPLQSHTQLEALSDLLLTVNKRPLFSTDFPTFLCLEPLSKAERPSVHGGGAGVLSGTLPRARGAF